MQATPRRPQPPHATQPAGRSSGDGEVGSGSPSPSPSPASASPVPRQAAHATRTCSVSSPDPAQPRPVPRQAAQGPGREPPGRELDERRRAWLAAARESEAERKQRTLTYLYDQRPAWLAHLHPALNRAVWAAYGWADADPGAVAEDAILSRLLALNGERADAVVGKAGE